MKNFVISLLLALFFPVMAHPQLRLPHILSDNMVLQANQPARLWGWAKPGATVTIKASWLTKPVTAKTAPDGKWTAALNTPPASYKPLTITFAAAGKTITLKNILSGEVWVCAGQSNMEMPIEGFGDCPVEGYTETVIDARTRSSIRFVKIPSIMRTTPQDDADCRWEATDMESVNRISATGYFFAHLLTRALDIPIGLILANKGGTRVESWLTQENLQRHTTEPLDSAAMVQAYPLDYHRPLLWGNGTFHPILNYTVRGIIYYQGCSNVGDPGNRYSERLALLASQWRSQFRLGDIPFYFVEIAPFWYDNTSGIAGALIREQQRRAATLIPNSALVCTNDLVYDYELKQIHPCQKRPVGERLALHALAKTYLRKGIIADSPYAASWRFSRDTCYVTLADHFHCVNRQYGIEGFELAGPDSVFHPATATYMWDKGVTVTSPEVPNPIAVRYCFRNFAPGNLKNKAHLPLFPFRSDNW